MRKRTAITANCSTLLSGALLATCLTSGAMAMEPASCQSVRFSDPGWTDINATNGVTTVLLDALGYNTKVDLIGVPIGFESLKNKEIDIFLGNWMPAQQHFIDQYKADIDIVGANLEGAKFTLAVSKNAYDAGVKGFADLAKFAKKFDKRIYGIEAGAPANQKLQGIIDSDTFGLGDWRLVESGEQAMLSQVSRAVKKNDFIVFLAWEPHPMNVNYELKYLTGGDDYFGANYGGATIYTLTRKGYTDECTNVGRLLNNLKFTLTMENELIGSILDDGEQPRDAAAAWLKQHPEVLKPWLDGVKTFDGEPGLEAVQKTLL